MTPGAALGPLAPPGRRTRDVSPDPERCRDADEAASVLSSVMGDFGVSDLGGLLGVFVATGGGVGGET